MKGRVSRNHMDANIGIQNKEEDLIKEILVKEEEENMKSKFR